MQQKSQFPDWIYFETKLYHFSLEWNELAVLRIEAGKKTDPTLCFVGQLRSQQLDKGASISSLLQFLKEKELESSLTKADYLSLIATIIDQTQEGKGYSCRLIYGEKIKSVKVQPIKVHETYFLTKKIEALQHKNKSDRLVLVEYNNEITKKIEEKDYQMKKAFSENMEGLVSAIAHRIQKKIEEKSKGLKNQQLAGLEDVFQEGGVSLKKIEKKIRKKIKKELKEKKRQKRQKRRQKEKKRKEKRKEKERLKALLQQNGGILPIQNLPHIDLDNLQNHQEEVLAIPDTTDQPFLGLDNTNIFNVDEVQGVGEHRKKKKKKEKHKKEERQKSDLHFKPLVTSLDGMNKLRARDFFPKIDDAIQIIEDTAQSKQKKEKKSKQKKKKKQKQEQKMQQGNEQVEEQGEKQYYRRLQEIRKSGDIDQARIARANRSKPTLAPPKPPLLQVDEFNPNYNGQPKYKPFVNINEGHAVRPGQIFGGSHRLAQTTAQYKRIPIIFRQETPTFKNFIVNGCVVRKKQGLNYQQIVFDYPIPTSGKHILTMRVIQSKKMYIWFGVIDIREKDRIQSYNKKSTIAFSFRTGHITTSTKWTRSKTGQVSVGLAVRMQVDMDQNSITYRISDGRLNSCPIPKLFRKQTLVPYFQMMEAGDQVCFQQ